MELSIAWFFVVNITVVFIRIVCVVIEKEQLKIEVVQHDKKEETIKDIIEMYLSDLYSTSVS